MKIQIINGPNLNLIGNRETSVYGTKSLDDFFLELINRFPNTEIDIYQSNIEGEIIDKIQQCAHNVNAIIINAGAYTHTSIAIADTLASIQNIPKIEVHISNIFSRESYRHISYIAPKCLGSIIGFGLKGYEMAISYVLANKDL